MKTVFVLQHLYEREDGSEEIKFIGMYSTKANADEAVKRLLIEPGFCDHRNGFSIDEYEFDQDHWTEGFVSVDP